jgi:hypothetical protein
MEIFVPLKNQNDDMEEFSLPTLEAIPHETPDEIPARSAKISCASAFENLTIVQHGFEDDNIHVRNDCFKAG